MFSRVFEDLTWVAELSNGQHAFQSNDPKGWLHLKQYCDEHNLGLNWIELQFRSHIERIQGAEAYYIAQTVSGDIFSDNMFGGYNVGALIDGALCVDTWRSPELIIVDQNKRDPEQYKHLLIKTSVCPKQ